MAEAKKTVKVEEGIWKRQGGTYSVRVRDGVQEIRKAFPTLRAARAFRNGVIKQRPPLAQQRGTYVPPDIVDSREQRRQQIRSARRSTTTRDGRTYTVVHLPPATGGNQ